MPPVILSEVELRSSAMIYHRRISGGAKIIDYIFDVALCPLLLSVDSIADTLVSPYGFDYVLQHSAQGDNVYYLC